MTHQPNPQSLHFGLLLLPQYQWLDAAGPVDTINNHSKAILTWLQAPPALIEKAPIITWSYISHDLSPVHPTSGAPETPTETYESCPKLDYLVVPGPDPTKPLPAGCAEFLKARFEELTGLLTVCTGSIAIAQSGILDGFRVCSNKFTLKRMAEAGMLDKKITWVGDRRWVVDGKVWSAAGITAGLDLAAEFSRVTFGAEIADLISDVMEYQGNPAHPDQHARLLEGVKLN